jgi:hypothetical protein
MPGRERVPNRRREPPKDVFPTEDEIAERAYELLLHRSSAADGLTDYWRLAEAELLERGARRIVRTGGPRQNR